MSNRVLMPTIKTKPDFSTEYENTLKSNIPKHRNKVNEFDHEARISIDKRTRVKEKARVLQKANVGIKDLNILLNMVAKTDKTVPPLPKKPLQQQLRGRINEGSYAVEYFFNETETDESHLAYRTSKDP